MVFGRWKSPNKWVSDNTLQQQQPQINRWEINSQVSTIIAPENWPLLPQTSQDQTPQNIWENYVPQTSATPHTTLTEKRKTLWDLMKMLNFFSREADMAISKIGSLKDIMTRNAQQFEGNRRWFNFASDALQEANVILNDILFVWENKVQRLALLDEFSHDFSNFVTTKKANLQEKISRKKVELMQDAAYLRRVDNGSLLSGIPAEILATRKRGF